MEVKSQVVAGIKYLDRTVDEFNGIKLGPILYISGMMGMIIIHGRDQKSGNVTNISILVGVPICFSLGISPLVEIPWEISTAMGEKPG